MLWPIRGFLWAEIRGSATFLCVHCAYQLSSLEYLDDSPRVLHLPCFSNFAHLASGFHGALKQLAFIIFTFFNRNILIFSYIFFIFFKIVQNLLGSVGIA